jgi:uncharacterized protein with HEPN domain
VKCNEIIEHLYNNDKINDLIKKIHPIELQQDLKQELAIILLEYDCEKLIKISKEGNIIGFAMQVIWTMGTSNTSPFYYKYRKSNIEKAIEYIRLQNGKEMPNSAIITAERYLENKLQSNSMDAHESIIFKKYVELRSCVDVAKYFEIPKDHVFAVVKKMKHELKKAING